MSPARPLPKRRPKRGGGRLPGFRHLLFGALPQPVRFRGCDELIAAIRSILRGWRVRQVDPRKHPSPVIRVARRRAGYRRVSCWQHRPSLVREHTRPTLVQALCGFHFEFLDWVAAQRTDLLFLHGAAALFGRQLVLFPAVAKAGKSTLSVHLAQAGRRIFCDDVIGVDTRTLRGVSLGIVPRLRPPLPPASPPALQRFLEARRGHGEGNRLYVGLRGREVAPLGETAPIGGIVVLERRKRARPSLTPIDPADAMERILLQDFTRKVAVPRILDVLAKVVGRAACYRLRYVHTADAVALLAGTFGPRSRP